MDFELYFFELYFMLHCIPEQFPQIKGPLECPTSSLYNEANPIKLVVIVILEYLYVQN